MTCVWLVIKLGELVSFKTGKLDSNAAVPTGCYPFFTCSQETMQIDTYSFDTECVLLAGNNANGIFPLKYFHGKFDAYKRTYILRPLESGQLDTKFLYFALRPKLTELRSYSTGAATKFLTLSILNETTLDLPNLPIQRRIASILSAYDDLIENHRKRIAILEEMARRLYREWFVHFRYPGHESVPLVDSSLGMIPQGWEISIIENVCSRIASGSTPSRGNQALWANGTIDWYKTQELWDNDLFVAEEKVRPGPSVRIFYSGTILIAIYGASIGRLGLLRSPSSCNQAALGLVPDGVRTCRSHLYYTLFFLRDYFVGIAQGAAQQNISKEKVAGTVFTVPVVDVLKQFEGIVGPMMDFRYNLTRQISILRQTRDLLLPRLMSGTLSVTAAEAAVP